MSERCAFFRLLLAAPLVAVACAQNELGDPTGSTCPADSTLTYQNYGEAFMQHHCARCHDDLSTHAGVQVSIDRIDRAAAAGPAAVNTYMPEDDELTEAERKQLGQWLACGAP